MICYVDDLTFPGGAATPGFLWKAKHIVDRHGFRYHKDRAYRSDQDKVVTGTMIRGDRVTVLSSREHDLARDINALCGMDAKARLTAIDRLMGKAVAASQIDKRFLARVKRLKFARMEAKLDYEMQIEAAWQRRRDEALKQAVEEETPPW